MPNPVQFDISVGALPDNFDTDPQGMLEAFAARLFISPSVPWSSFVLGAAQPTSDLGPWFKDGKELWVWDDVSATYIPLRLNPASLGYAISNTAPDPNIYKIWIETNVGGSPLAMKIYFGGNWVDVYSAQFANYSTTTAMNAAIAAAVSGASPQTYPAQATQNAAQTIDVDNTYKLIVLDNAQINPAPAPFITASSRYVAPVNGVYKFSAIVQIDNISATLATLETIVAVFKNGVVELGTQGSLTNLAGSRQHANFSGMVQLNATDYIDIRIKADDGVNTGDVEVGNVDFTAFLVKPI